MIPATAFITLSPVIKNMKPNSVGENGIIANSFLNRKHDLLILKPCRNKVSDQQDWSILGAHSCVLGSLILGCGQPGVKSAGQQLAGLGTQQEPTNELGKICTRFPSRNKAVQHLPCKAAIDRACNCTA